MNKGRRDGLYQSFILKKEKKFEFFDYYRFFETALKKATIQMRRLNYLA
jgi:hypothetical protein